MYATYGGRAVRRDRHVPGEGVQDEVGGSGVRRRVLHRHEVAAVRREELRAVRRDRRPTRVADVDEGRAHGVRRQVDRRDVRIAGGVQRRAVGRHGHAAHAEGNRDRCTRRVGRDVDRRHRAVAGVRDPRGRSVGRDRDRERLGTDVDRRPRSVRRGVDRCDGVRVTVGHVGGLAVGRDRHRGRTGADRDRGTGDEGAQVDRGHRVVEVVHDVRGPGRGAGDRRGRGRRGLRTAVAAHRLTGEHAGRRGAGRVGLGHRHGVVAAGRVDVRRGRCRGRGRDAVAEVPRVRGDRAVLHRRRRRVETGRRAGRRGRHGHVCDRRLIGRDRDALRSLSDRDRGPDREGRDVDRNDGVVRDVVDVRGGAVGCDRDRGAESGRRDR